jgi:hypothetical protein
MRRVCEGETRARVAAERRADVSHLTGNRFVAPGWPPGYEDWPKDGPLVKVVRLEPNTSGPTVWVSISTDRWGEDYSLDGVYATEALALAAVDDTPLTVVRIIEEPLRGDRT